MLFAAAVLFALPALILLVVVGFNVPGSKRRDRDRSPEPRQSVARLSRKEVT